MRTSTSSTTTTGRIRSNTLAKFAKPRREAGPIDVVARVEGDRARASTTAASPRFLDALWKKKKLGAGDGHAVMNLCMAATYDPDPTAPNGFRVPFDLETGELIEARWKRWLANDPIHMVGRHAAALKRAARHLHRLRLGRPVPHPLRHAHPVEAAARARHRARLRGVRRQPLRHRLPDGRRACRSSHAASPKRPRRAAAAERRASAQEQPVGRVVGLVHARIAERREERVERLALVVGGTCRPTRMRP